MAEKEVVISEGLEYRGIFNFSGFYEFAYHWLKEEGYEVVEDKYQEKVTGNSREIAVDWKAGKPVSDYFKAEIDVRILILGATDVEVEIEGVRKKMNKGKIELKFKGSLVKDPESEWEGSPFFRFLRGMYNKFIIGKNIEQQEDQLKEDVQDLNEEIKAFLEIQGRR